MEEQFKQGQIPKPKFSERGEYLEELANLENYIGIYGLKQKIEGKGFGLIREISLPIDEVHNTVGMVYQKT